MGFLFLAGGIFVEVLFFFIIKETINSPNSKIIFFSSLPLIGISLFLSQKAIHSGLNASMIYTIWSISGIIILAAIGHYRWGEKLNIIGVISIALMLFSITAYSFFGQEDSRKEIEKKLKV